MGLFNPAERTQPSPPQPFYEHFCLRNFPQELLAKRCAESLLKVLHIQKNNPIKVELSEGRIITRLLSTFVTGLGGHTWLREMNPPEEIPNLPLGDVWLAWWEEQERELHDARFFVLFQLLASYRQSERGNLQHGYISNWLHQHLFNRDVKRFCDELYGEVGKDVGGWQFPEIMRDIFRWLLIRIEPRDGEIDKLLDAVEHSLFLVNQVSRREQGWWRESAAWRGWIEIALFYQNLCGYLWSDAQNNRLWQLLCWYDAPQIPSLPRSRPNLIVLMRAFHSGGANRADIIDHLIGMRSRYDVHDGLGTFQHLSHRYPDKRYGRSHYHEFALDTELQVIIQECRERIVTVATMPLGQREEGIHLALSLSYAGGFGAFRQIISAFKDGYFRIERLDSGETDDGILTQLLRSTVPKRGETPEVALVPLQELRLSDSQWVEVAAWAPLWADHIEKVIVWPFFADAVWWLHAHMKYWEGYRRLPEQSIINEWMKQIARRTPIRRSRLYDGSVDVDWFFRTYNALGKERWHQIEENVHIYTNQISDRKTSSRRLTLFSDALLGHLPESTLYERVWKKRHQDTLRALGLAPLPNDDCREEELLNRYKTCHEFLRTSRQFGAQRRASEKLAVEISLENLTRIAGYPDPTRLEWAMEEHALTDLAAGPITVEIDPTTVSLKINERGEPQIDVYKKGRSLKNIPLYLKKSPAIIELVQRRKEIAKQSKRMQYSLEAAMCYGDEFTWSEIVNLLHNPLLKPKLNALLFVYDDRLGLIHQQNLDLIDVQGIQFNVTPDSRLRIAHPHDLYLTNEVEKWQEEYFPGEKQQPFKQLYRKYYSPSIVEDKGAIKSLRYNGEWVRTKQMLALLNERGWDTSEHETGIHKSFPREGFTSYLSTNGGWIPSVSDKDTALEAVYFSQEGNWQDAPLADVPPRLFSEVMRDIDLIASVAGNGDSSR